MSPSADNLGNKFYSLMMFLVVSVLSGLLLSGLFVPAAALVGAGTKGAAVALESLPTELATPPQSEGSRLLLSDGTVLATFYAEDRTYVPLAKISKIMQRAQLAIEDHRFYEHGALDFYGTMRALLVSGGAQGGSTITQQYVKQVQIEAADANGDAEGVRKAQERTLSRKVQELRYAIAMEKKFSKDQILERYLNIAYYGDGAYGVEAAAHHYFNTTAAKLTLEQAAMIAGLVQNPVATDPVNHPLAATDRRNTVLARMLQLDVITQAQFDKATLAVFNAKLVQGKKRGCVGTRYPMICDYAYRELLNTKSIGATPDDADRNLKRLNFTIVLSIDPKLQDVTQGAIGQFYAPTDPVVSTVAVVKPGTGKILTMAQSRPQMGTGAGQTFWDYNAVASMGGAEGYHAGSTFKIFTTAAAVDKGIPPTKTYRVPAKTNYKGQIFENCQGKYVLAEDYQVQNDDLYSGTPDMYFAAQDSVNNYFIPLERDVGICNVAKMAIAAGAQRADGGTIMDNVVPSLTLGTVEIAPLSMANAYATFAARGLHCDNSIIASIKSRTGNSLATMPANCKQVIRQEVADGVNAIFLTVVTKGMGSYAAFPGSFNYDFAGKTGTAEDAATLWFDGYTPDIAASSMVTVDKTNAYWKDVKTPSLYRMTMPVSGSWMTGFGAPDMTRVFRLVFQYALPLLPNTKFTPATTEILQGKMVTIPQLSWNIDADQVTLESAGFTVQRIFQTSSARAGTYLGPNPGPGAQVSVGTTVYLVISSGPRPAPADAKPAPPTAGPTKKKP